MPNLDQLAQALCTSLAENDEEAVGECLEEYPTFMKLILGSHCSRPESHIPAYWTPLHCAARWGRAEALGALIRLGEGSPGRILILEWHHGSFKSRTTLPSVFLTACSSWHQRKQQPRQQCKLGQRWPNVGTTVPTLGQRWANLHCYLGKVHISGPCEGWPVDSPHKEPVMWNVFSHHIFMESIFINYRILSTLCANWVTFDM